MARERRRLLIPAERLARDVTLTAAEAHYLKRVLRLSQGQGCDVVDGAGHRWGALLRDDDRLQLEQPLAQPLEHQPRSQPLLALAVALPRQEVELIWRMASELGIDHLYPLQGERSMGRNHWPLDRWRSVVKEATEQSERLWLPELAQPQSAMAWFSQPRPGLHLLATSRGAHLPHLQDKLPQASQLQPGPPPAQVCVAIGPEGGWSPAEEAAAQAKGWSPVSAGPTILRTVTAAVAAAAWMAGWRALLSSSSSRGQSL